MRIYGWKCKKCGYGDYSTNQRTGIQPEDHMTQAGHGKWNYISYGIELPDQITEDQAAELHHKV